MTVRTIWSPGAVNHIPHRYRPLVHVVYPAIYAINVALYGVVGTLTGGSDVLQQALPMPYANILLGLLGLCAAVALVGLVFVGQGGRTVARGQIVERVGVIGLVPCTMVYLIVLVFSLFGPQGDPEQAPPFGKIVHGVDAGLNTPIAALVGVLVMLLFASLRAWDLSSELGKRGQTRAGS